MITPVEKVDNILIKRDDLYDIFGSIGGKARSCYSLIKSAKEKGYKGVTTAGSRESPQVLLVSNIAKHMGMKAVAHTPTGSIDGTPVGMARDVIGCEIIQHKAGYNNVIIKRSRDYAEEHNFFDIPFGMACWTAVTETAGEARALDKYKNDIKRVVIPIGSGMSTAGIVTGLAQMGIKVPVLGVSVGASPVKRLDMYAPILWRLNTSIINAGVPYSKHIPASIGEIELDGIYEAKCLPFLEDGDLFWIVGTRDMPSIGKGFSGK